MTLTELFKCVVCREYFERKKRVGGRLVRGIRKFGSKTCKKECVKKWEKQRHWRK